MKSILCLILLSCTLHATVKCVDDDNRGITELGDRQYPFATIQSAIDDAMDGDTLKIAEGTYAFIDTKGKSLLLLGGYAGATTAQYASGAGGDFINRSEDATRTIVEGTSDSIAINVTRFTFDPYSFVIDNMTVRKGKKGIVIDKVVSWPHADNVTISNCIIENNGKANDATGGAGIVVTGRHHNIVHNIIRNNKGGRGAAISGEGGSPDSLLISDNIIQNNTGYDDHCAGVYISGFVTIRNNIISGNRLENSYGWGGGVLVLGTAYMSNNKIFNNYCPSYGGALFVDEGGTAYLDNELIYNNRTDVYGAAIAIDYGEPGNSRVFMNNCTVVNNYSPDNQGGNAVYVDSASSVTIKNCIFWGNNGDDLFVRVGSTASATYTLSQETLSGVGNISMDPLFADTAKADFHLKSLKGRYDDKTMSWMTDNVDSPAIDAGDPSSPYSNEPAPNGKRVDLGCYGNTSFASKSSAIVSVPSEIEVLSDFRTSPNPCTNTLSFDFSTSQGGPVLIQLYNERGELLQSFADQFADVGLHSYTLSTAECHTGVLLYSVLSHQMTKWGMVVCMRE